ncbi:MAG: C_GCAxxG_C_C family protein [Lachnospiraceae bacterium]|nr:C_GCAxxG_C_C family protein [Lachnospiraceae bacterium]
MDKNQIAEQAVNYKRNGYNCCQAVVTALAEQVGRSPEELNKLAAGFAVGMGNMEATCGSLIGATMIAGLKTEGAGTVMYARQLSDRFKELSGALICKDLKGRDTGVVICPCEECVRNAVLAYADVMEQ